MLRRLLSMFTGSGTRRRRRTRRTRGGLISRLLSALRAFFGSGRRTRTRTRI